MRILPFLLLVFSFSLSSSAAGPPGRALALTFDDLPLAPDAADLALARSVNARLLAALRAHHAPAIGFVTESKLQFSGERDARVALLVQWLDAGLLLGNHTFSHPRLQDTPVEEYEDDVIRGEVVTRALMRQRGHAKFYFRHPYTSTGATRQDRDRFETFLRARGYDVAPFTIENADYVFNVVYERALTGGESELAERVRRAYLDHLDAVLGYFEELSRKELGYEVRQILLIHANRINAECLPEMLDRMEARGYRFLTLDGALEDKAYRIRDDYVGPMGISWLHRWTVGLGQTMDIRNEPDPPQFIRELYKKMRR